jgi:hypothetical protein
MQFNNVLTNIYLYMGESIYPSILMSLERVLNALNIIIFVLTLFIALMSFCVDNKCFHFMGVYQKMHDFLKIKIIHRLCIVFLAYSLFNFASAYFASNQNDIGVIRSYRNLCLGLIYPLCYL